MARCFSKILLAEPTKGSMISKAFLPILSPCHNFKGDKEKKRVNITETDIDEGALFCGRIQKSTFGFCFCMQTWEKNHLKHQHREHCSSEKQSENTFEFCNEKVLTNTVTQMVFFM